MLRLRDHPFRVMPWPAHTAIVMAGGQVMQDEPEHPAPKQSRVRSAADSVHGKALGSAEKATERYQRTRKWLDQTPAGHLQRQIAAVDLMNHALIFAALALMLVVPLLLSLAALVPLGSPHGLVATFAHRMGLSQQAVEDLQQLFPSKQTVRGGVTWLGVVVTMVSAFAWPAVLQRGYELAWRLPALGWRSRWRALLWLLSFVAAVAVSASLTAVVSGGASQILLVLFGLPAVTAWAWWGQHVLLGGRIGWRLLLPGAIAIAIGLYCLRLYGVIFFSRSITTNYARYGALGVVLMVLSALVSFSVVMFGGAVVGVTLHERPLRLRRRRGCR